MKKRMAMAVAATVALGLGAGATAANADDYVYWMKFGMSPSIARATVDGSGVNESFIASPGTMADGLAVTGDSIYWTTGMNSLALAKAAIDGTGVNSNVGLIGANISNHAVAVDGAYAYVPTAPPGASLGRIGTDGSGLNGAFVSSVFGNGAQVTKIATDGTYLYLGTNGTQIARANLDGTGLVSNLITTSQPYGGLAAAGGYVYWTNTTSNDAIGRANSDGTNKQENFISGLDHVRGAIAANSQYIFWYRNGGCSTGSYCIGRANADGTGVAQSQITGLTASASALSIGVPGPAPTPTPTPGPTPSPSPDASASSGSTSGGSAAPMTPAATVLAAPTQSSTADSNGDVAVSLALQLDEVGKYTFIFEKVTSNEMSREQASGSSRISMQKGTKIGKRKLTKAITAANVTTTSTGAKLVMRALLKKAQAKKWNLRVIHTATDGSQSQSVIAK